MTEIDNLSSGQREQRASDHHRNDQSEQYTTIDAEVVVAHLNHLATAEPDQRTVTDHRSMSR